MVKGLALFLEGRGVSQLIRMETVLVLVLVLVCVL